MKPTTHEGQGKGEQWNTAPVVAMLSFALTQHLSLLRSCIVSVHDALLAHSFAPLSFTVSVLAFSLTLPRSLFTSNKVRYGFIYLPPSSDCTIEGFFFFNHLPFYSFEVFFFLILLTIYLFIGNILSC